MTAAPRLRAKPPAGKTRSNGVEPVGELIYLLDVVPGIRRHKTRGRFQYQFGEDAVRDRKTLERIKRLAIPPAWTDVWISPEPLSHLQASGRDARNRKQYRYHARWREIQDESKFDRTIAFGLALPRIRERVDADLALPGLPQEKVLAALVKLLDATLIRVGNIEYARSNGSYGLTTLRDRHVAVDKSKVSFEFRGKTGKLHRLTLQDRRLAGVIKRCRDLPGYELFQYLDEEGNRRRVTSAEVNAYLREASGDEFSTKDFRTWNGTVLAACAFLEAGNFSSATEARQKVVSAVTSVAAQLGNTPAVCRRSYIHPYVIAAFLNGSLESKLARGRGVAGGTASLETVESAVLELLRRSA